MAVTYEYDAWGRQIGYTTSGDYGSILYSYNRLKYRGYYYDSDLGLYYLNTRFYDPAIGRFINADTIELVLVSQSTLSDKNLYAYCDNNPVMRRDESGTAWETVFDVITLVASIADVVAEPDNVWAWAGLVGDIADVAIPFFGGIGETIKVCGAANKADDIIDIAKKSGSNTTKLYRVMSEAEYDSVMTHGKFVPYDRAMEEKWFATTAEDATKWADIFYPDGNYKMLEIEVDTNALSQMYYNQHLDNIGPAYCASLETLENAIKFIKGGR